MDERYDVVVVGTGTSAAQVVAPLAKAGRRVLVVDEREYGGTCALRGCQPKKFLVAAAAAVHRARQMAEIGVAGPTRIDWAALQAHRAAFTDPVPESTRDGFAEAGAKTARGHARFVAPDRLAIGDREVSAETIVLATGAKPRALGIAGEEHLSTSEDFLYLPALPDRIVFVGGGYVSLELAFVAAVAGANVTVLEHGDRVLSGFDAGLVGKLTTAASDAGIRIETKTGVDRIERRDGRFVVGAAGPDGREFAADLVVHGAGRVPNLDGMDLEAGGVKRTEAGVEVDDRLRSVSNPAVRAIGDCAATPFDLAPTGDMEGRAVASDLLGEPTEPPDYGAVPTVAFTLPPIARVGLGEDEAREQGKRFRVSEGETAKWPSSRRIGQKHGGYRVLVEEETDRILGAHLLGAGAEEAIDVFALAIRHGLTRTDLKRTVWSYPTHVSDVSSML